jgi:hypothetical protein
VTLPARPGTGGGGGGTVGRMAATADLNGTVVLITGANSGIGKQASIGLARLGAT